MQITEATYRLIEQLFGRRGVFELFGKDLQSHTETIARIEGAGESAAALHLAIYALGAKAPLRARAAQAAENLLATVPPEDLFLLDQHARRMNFFQGSVFTDWANLRPGQLPALQGQTSGTEALLGMFSFHHNGRVREEAVRLLGQMNGGAELPFLLIRLNDWVPAIRSLALKAIQARLVPAYATYFAANISLVYKLLEWKRADHSSVLEWIVEYLRKPECGEAVTALQASPDRSTRRLVFRLLARPQDDGFPDLLQRALRDQDPTIRLWSIRQARQHLTGAQAADMARRGIADRYSRVRAQAAYIYAEQTSDASAPAFRAALLDASPAIRSIGRFYLARIETVDFPALYRSRVDSSSGREKANAIAALGDVGAASDADFLAPYAQDSNGRIRIATLQALARLDGDRFIDLFLLALVDRSPAVAKEAARALSKRTALLDLESLWSEAGKPQPSATQHRILTLLFKGPKWDSLYYAMASLSHSDPGVVLMARHQMERWIQEFRHSGVPPDARQRARVVEILEKYGHLIRADIAKTIRFHLG